MLLIEGRHFSDIEQVPFLRSYLIPVETEYLRILHDFEIELWDTFQLRLLKELHVNLHVDDDSHEELEIGDLMEELPWAEIHKVSIVQDHKETACLAQICDGMRDKLHTELP